ncbi:MAG: heparinase II/III family protein [Gemmatimonadota bacterium]|nr:MAG: heparinase II/III family protein [Gemmatimonadota bacterium]
MKRRADEALSADIQKTTLERKKSEYAKALAFAYVVTEDTAYAEKAAEILGSIRTRSNGGNWGDIHQEMDAVPNYCQAYDMIASFLKHHPNTHKIIRDNLYNEGHRLYTYSSLKETANNWRIRRCAALGMCALAIADYGEGGEGSGPKDWHSSAIKGFLRTIDHQTTSDGGHAEGPNYLRYSANLYIPYLTALYRATGQNIFQREPLQSLHDWGIKIRLPNGQRPNFDDAALDWFYGGLFAAHTSHPSFHQWDWVQAEGEHFCPGYKKIDALCHFDDGIETKGPVWNPTLFLPEAGNAVFRSDWSPDAIYMLLLGEHGKAQLHGGAHDQPDPMSFIIYAYGKMLALDGGYINWKERHKVNKPKNHNLILVDDKGPTAPKWFLGWHGGTDAQLQNYFATHFLDYCEVKTRYQGVDFVRHVFFPEHRYFITVDEIRSSEKHHYTWLLHGNGLSSDGTFTLTESGGVWVQDDVSFHAFVTSPSEAIISEREDIHSLHYGEERNHSLIAAETEAEDTRYLGVLYPRKEGDALPTVSAFKYETFDGVIIRRGGSMDIVAIQEGDSEISIPESMTGHSPIRTNAKIFLAGFQNGMLKKLSGTGGSLYEHNDLALFASDRIITLAIQQTESGLTGHVRGDGSYHLEFTSDRQPTAVFFRNSPINFQYENGKIVLYLEGEGILELRW